MCDQNFHTKTQYKQQDQTITPCTHAYDHITQHIDNLDDPTQQHIVYTNEVDASLFTMDATIPCDYNISTHILNSDNFRRVKLTLHNQWEFILKVNINTEMFLAILTYNIMILTKVMHSDKYTMLLQQELHNPYWCLHNPIVTKSYQISSEMDIETMPHGMYFSSNKETITKINQVPYQVIDYDDKGMFQAKLMDNTQVEIFIDNGATPSILPLNVHNKYPIMQKYPKMESHTPIHTGGGMIESRFWIEIPLKLDNQIIQIKTLVCDSECPYDTVLGHTSLAQLSAWQDYASRQLFIQQISILLIAKKMLEYCQGTQELYLWC